MDLKKLTTGEMVVAAAGVLLLIFSFFDWFGVDVGPASYGENGWDNIFSLLAVLIGIVMAAQVIATKLAGANLPEKMGNLGWGQLHLFLGAAALILVVLQLIIGADVGGFDLDRKIGVFLGLIASIGLAAGGFLIAKERGELPAQLGGAGGTAPPAA